MEKEIVETYYFTPSDYDYDGQRKSDGVSLRDVIKGFERNFHQLHSTEYAMNLYANEKTMGLLAKSCNAAPFLTYGMLLTQGKNFDPRKDPTNNHTMDKISKEILVYGIDSAFMTDFDENGYPIFDDDTDIYPLTLLVDDSKSMRDGTIKLSVPTADDDESERVTNDVPQFELA